MADVAVLVGVLVFFALSMLYVAGLDRIVGHDDDELITGAASDDPGRDEVRVSR